MNEHIEWVLDMKIQDGKTGDVQPLVDEMVAATHAKTYEYYLTPDGQRCTVLERYADNDAALVHLENFGAHFADRFLSIFSPERFTVYGPANDTLRSALEGFGATFDARIAGFQRG